MDMATNTFVATLIAERATPLSLDLDALFDDLAPLANRARDGKVVALGSAPPANRTSFPCSPTG